MNTEVDTTDTLEPPNIEKETAQAESERQQGAIILALVVISVLIFFSLVLSGPGFEPVFNRQGTYIVGMVTDSNDNPLEDVEIEVAGSSNPAKLTAYTGSDGTFGFFVLSDHVLGNYIILSIPEYDFTRTYDNPSDNELDVGTIVL